MADEVEIFVAEHHNLVEDYRFIREVLRDKRTRTETDGRKRMFIVEHEVFLALAATVGSWGDELVADDRLSSMKYNNFALSLSVCDEYFYFICEEAKPFLDSVWEAKAPKETSVQITKEKT